MGMIGSTMHRRAGKPARTMEGQRVLDVILKAQQSHPSYETALSEISHGRKLSHWIWYIWPALRQLRPRTSRPQYLLPNLEAAQLYLTHQILRDRLCEITRAASEQLRSGVDARVLFGGGGDWRKFHETCTFFAIAALEERDLEVVDLCCEALELRPYDGQLNRAAMEVLCKGYHPTHFAGFQTTGQVRAAIEATRAPSHSQPLAAIVQCADLLDPRISPNCKSERARARQMKKYATGAASTTASKNVTY